MTLDFASVPLAAAAGALGVLSPCVWPLVPVVMSSATTGGRSGPWWLAAGLGLSFALAGTLLSGLLVSAGLEPAIFRRMSAGLLIAVALVILVPALGERFAVLLSGLSARFQTRSSASSPSGVGQLGVGALLGLVWLPCVGPTLGAAIALASLGQDLGLVFVVMASFGFGTALALLVAGRLSVQVLARLRPRIGAHAGLGKRALGWTLLLLGVLVASGLDKTLESWIVPVLPAFTVAF